MKPLLAQLAQAAARHPNKTALHYGGYAISYADLQTMSQRAARGLERAGVGEGDRLAIWLPNVPAFVVLLLACLRLGALAVNVNTRFRASELASILGRTGAKALVFWPGFKAIPFLDILAELDPAALDRLDTIILYDEGESPPPALPLAEVARLRYAELLRADAAEARAPEGEGGVLFTTSGTTKAPKFVRHGQRASAAHGASVARAWGYDDANAKILIATPLCGIFGYTQLVAAIAAGATMELHPVMDAEAIVRALRGGATHMNGTDTLFRRVLEAAPEQRPFPHFQPTPLAPFDYPPEDTVAFADKRGLTIVGAYGMTEIFAMFTRQPPQAPVAERARGGGYLVSRETEMRVRDPDSGLLLPAGERGEFEVRGPSLLVEYYGDPEATAAAFTADGFLRTGDVGCIAADGRILYEARMGEMARLGGFLVNPVEIEAVILRHPAIGFAQVVVAPTAGGNRAVGFVIMKPGAALDEVAVLQMCAAQIARYKLPARIVALSEYPTTEGVNGAKIQRAKLREMAQALLAGN